MTLLQRHLARLVVAALAATAGLVGLGAQPAAAALCTGKGVSVFVDYQQLGRSAQTACDPNGGGRSADKVFNAAGVKLTMAQRSPGFVCRVNDLPASDPCVDTSPANAYWGLFWSDGKGGEWKYSSLGVAGLKVPEGGSVAFSWQAGSRTPPKADPVRNTKPTPKPTPAPPKNTQKPAPTKGTGGAGGAGGTKPGATSTPTKVAVVPQATSGASATPTPTAAVSASAAAAASASAAASATVSASPSGSASPSPAIAADSDGAFKPVSESSGLPVWVPVVVILVLALAAWVGLWWRNRSGEA